MAELLPDSLPADDPRCSWLAEFRRRHGRAPRLLHIGNIASNAYLNAKILNAVGLDCDAICADFYHIMGCPEWEDADFTGGWQNDFYPAWDRVDLHGFRHPPWFAQGPVISCLRYLRMRRQGRQRGAEFYHRCLSQQRRLNTHLLRLQEQKKTWPARWPRLELKGWLRLANLIERLSGSRPADLPPDAWTENALIAFMDRVAELSYEFRMRFPDRADRLSAGDVVGYFGFLAYWRDLMRRYDAVIGYGLDGCYPLLTGIRPYIAFEHGTIRNIPFQPTSQGRLAALTYRSADHVFVTNADNQRAAKRLGLENYTFVPHPVNEEIAYGVSPVELRARLREQLNCDFIVFHPARQHWTAERHPDWEKGNDILIHGFARFVKTHPRAGAVFVEWGQKVEQTKQLLRELGIADRVLWVPPLPFRHFIAYIQATDLLADQFHLGAFGGIMPRALMLGRPAMLYLDEEVHRWCLPEMPPVLNVRTPNEVADSLRRLAESPALRQEMGAAGQQWYELYHSNRVIASRFVRVIGDVIFDRRIRSGQDSMDPKEQPRAVPW
jgi:glycosyltransferase involved in cell wall biosynthesis